MIYFKYTAPLVGAIVYEVNPDKANDPDKIYKVVHVEKKEPSGHKLGVTRWECRLELPTGQVKTVNSFTLNCFMSLFEKNKKIIEKQKKLLKRMSL